MKILAFDTSGQSFSAALMEDDRIICEETFTVKETHARHIMPVLDRILLPAGGDVNVVDRIAVTIGPGSFTGIRIGLGVAKGIAFALGVPVVGVSTLDALVWPFRDSACPVYALMDARRGEVYFSKYFFSNGEIVQKTPERVCSPEKALAYAAEEEEALFCGSGAAVYGMQIESLIKRKISLLNPESVINASDIARIAFKSGFSSASEINPVYLRRSEAEINYEIRNSSV